MLNHKAKIRKFWDRDKAVSSPGIKHLQHYPSVPIQ